MYLPPVYYATNTVWIALCCTYAVPMLYAATITKKYEVWKTPVACNEMHYFASRKLFTQYFWGKSQPCSVGRPQHFGIQVGYI